MIGTNTQNFKLSSVIRFKFDLSLLLLHPDPGASRTFGNLLEAGLVENSLAPCEKKLPVLALI